MIQFNLEVFQKIARMSQDSLLKLLSRTLVKAYGEKNVIITGDYLMAQGDIPIALVAHLDTVHIHLPQSILYDSQQKVLWSPQGLGADDRCGVLGILQLLQKGYRPSIIFTTDEEIGGLGAISAIQDYFNCPLLDVRYMIELDRKGKNEAVFYGCFNLDFQNYILSFGFQENMGTFSDISILCPSWGIAGVNLSIGYENEHTLQEMIFTDYYEETMNKVEAMLLAPPMTNYDYGMDLSGGFWDAGYCPVCSTAVMDLENPYQIAYHSTDLKDCCWEYIISMEEHLYE